MYEIHICIYTSISLSYISMFTHSFVYINMYNMIPEYIIAAPDQQGAVPYCPQGPGAGRGVVALAALLWGLVLAPSSGARHGKGPEEGPKRLLLQIGGPFLQRILLSWVHFKAALGPERPV